MNQAPQAEDGTPPAEGRLLRMCLCGDDLEEGFGAGPCRGDYDDNRAL
ncbi:MAG: hypothetical protein AAF333_05875 [Planctomycetota bacterium]